MNTEQIVSFLESKEAFDQKALSQIMLLLEKYPYFQTGHILLLKAMNQTHSENYSNQLNISGSFISDKKKLFQYINSLNVSAPLIADATTEKKTQTKVSDEKIPIKTTIEKIEKEIPVEKIEKEKPFEKIEIKQKIEIEKKEPEKIIEVEKIATDEKKTSDIEIAENLENIKKVDLSEDELIKLTTEKSKIRHKEIIKDFFQATNSPKINKDVIESEKEFEEKKKIVPLIEVKKDEIIKTKEQEKPEINKEIGEIKKTEDKSELKLEEVIKPEEKKIVIQEKVKDENAKPFEHKKIDITEDKNLVNEKVEKESTQLTETKKELQSNKTVENKEHVKTETGSSEVMSSIFSKIRQIKKEMNITSENTPETIDIQTGNEVSRLAKTKQTDEKKGSSRVIKETFIGFHEDEIKKEKISDPENNDDIEKEVIKESGITAKDLFKQHVKNKEQTTTTETENIGSESESLKNAVISPISKVVANLDEEKTNKLEIEKEITPSTFIETNKEITIEKKDDQTTSSNKSLSAAELLIKKIEDKKLRMKEEKEKEDREKHLENQRMIDLIQNPIIENGSEKLDKNTEIIPEQINETKTFDEPIQDKETNISENLTIENADVQEFKVKKSTKLIDNFIEKIETFEKIGSKESSLSGDVSISSTDEKEEFMTETMADIQIQQKNYPKAIEIYNKLILKFPEKKTYFAIQIKKIESLIKS